MEYPTMITSAIAIMISAGVVALGIGYLYSQYLKGKKGGTKEGLETENALVTYLKNQNEGLEKVIERQDEKRIQSDKEHAKELADVRDQLNTFVARIEEKDKAFEKMVESKNQEIEKYLKILQNRNPELEAFIAKLSLAADTQAIFNGELAKIMGNISEFMSEINIHMKQDVKIEGTLHKT